MSVLSVIKEVQQSVPIPKWKVNSGNIGTGVFVSTEVCNEWTFADYKKRQTWCVFGTGEGYVYFELAKRLVDAGHSPKTVFTSGMLVGYDIDIDSVNIIKEKIEHTFGIDKSQITVYNEDYFTLEKTVNFDNFIINPPYLDGSAGNIPVSHKHISKAKEHWTGKGQGWVITKSAPAMSNERHGDDVRSFVTNSGSDGSKVRFLPDDAFSDATVRTWIMGFNKKTCSNLLEVFGKDGNIEYKFDKDKDTYVFYNNDIRNILQIVGTQNNLVSKYNFKRNEKIKNTGTKVKTVTTILNGAKTVEKKEGVYSGYGKYAVGITFMVNAFGKAGTEIFEYRNHTKNSCLIEPDESLRKDYSCITELTKEEATSTLYQIQHPLNAWIQAHTRTSDQSSRTPQFKFCCHVSTDEFYNIWPNGNPDVKEYFSHWNIPVNYQDMIMEWFKQYV
jgi:methylase of polypeptide subunit release factors